MQPNIVRSKERICLFSFFKNRRTEREEEQKRREEQEWIRICEEKRALEEKRIEAQKEKEAIYQEQLNRKAKEKEIIVSEVEKFTAKYSPVALLIPEMRQFVISLMNQSTSMEDIKRTYDPSLVDAISEVWEDNLFIFLKLLETKGVSVQGNEKMILDLLVEAIEDKAYRLFIAEYGDFIFDGMTTKEAIYSYFEEIGIDRKEYWLLSGNLIPLHKILKQHRIIPEASSLSSLSNQVEELASTYEMEHKVRLLEKRLAEDETIAFRPTIADIDAMSGLEFEEFLCDLFTNMGYKIDTTKKSGDQGVDLLAYKNGECIAIQAKCYSSSVGNAAIQEVVAGMRYYNAQKSMAITNNYFTNGAKELAASTNTILWDRDKLKDMINMIY